jgi:uncharacterized membrane protein (DUF106 family)
MDSVVIGGLFGLIGGIVAILADRQLKRATVGKTDAERQDLEDRITERVLLRAEAEMAKLKQANDELRTENEQLRRDNAEQLKMMRVIRVITIRLVNKMEKAGIESDLTEEERDALYDTGKLKQYSRK